MPGTVANTALILLAVSESACRSLPNSLMEFSPLTPDTASATLSCRYCEKLNSTPGNSVCSFAQHFRRELVLVAEPLRHWLDRLQRREEFGVEEPGRVGAVVRPPVLRHHRFDLREAANDLAHAIDVSVAFLERDGGRHGRADPQVAFFELGQEFEPERADGDARKEQGARRRRRSRAAVGDGEVQRRGIQAVQHAHDPGFGFAHVLGQQDGADRRRHGESREQAAGQRIGIGLRHRPEDMAFDAAEREQRQKARDDDSGRKEDRTVDVGRGVKDRGELAGQSRRRAGRDRAGAVAWPRRR